MPRPVGESPAAMGRKIRSSAARQLQAKRCRREGAGRFGGSGDGEEDIDCIVVTLPFYSSKVSSFRTSSGGNSVRVSSESTLTRE